MCFFGRIMLSSKQIAAYATFAGAASLLTAAPAIGADAKVSAGDTAWVLTSSVLVLLMTTPGLALFYAGMVRRKNVLATLMHSFILAALISVQWALWGYSLAFSPWHAAMGASLRCQRNRSICRLCGNNSAPGLHGLSMHVRGHHASADYRCVCRTYLVQGVFGLQHPMGDAHL